MTDTRRRVKLYALNADRQWDDRGTGHVSSSYVERLKGISLLVRAESDGSLLLESKIQPDTAYQKQQVIREFYEFVFLMTLARIYDFFSIINIINLDIMLLGYYLVQSFFI